MKFVTSAAALCLAASQSFAGGFAAEVIEPEQIIVVPTETAGSLPGWVVPAAIAIALIAVATQGGSDGEDGGDGGGATLSDSRLKTDIVQIGTAANGLPLYRFRYIGQTQVWQGVMAQDVLAVQPQAVVVGPLGYYQVDYGMLGLEMRAVD